MALIKDFKNYLNEIQNEFPEIGKNRMVTDEKQLTRYINDLHLDENLFLVGVLPNFGNNNPSDADAFRWKAFTEFILVEKTDYSELTDEEFVNQYDRILEVLKKIGEKLLEDHTEGNCGFLRMLDPTSFQIVEVFHLAQCNGWTLTFSFDVWR